MQCSPLIRNQLGCTKAAQVNRNIDKLKKAAILLNSLSLKGKTILRPGKIKHGLLQLVKIKTLVVSIIEEHFHKTIHLKKPFFSREGFLYLFTISYTIKRNNEITKLRVFLNLVHLLLMCRFDKTPIQIVYSDQCYITGSSSS